MKRERLQQLVGRATLSAASIPILLGACSPKENEASSDPTVLETPLPTITTYVPTPNLGVAIGEENEHLQQICQTISPDSFPETTGRLKWPVWGRLTQWFWPDHQGLDIEVDFGESVKAADGGAVVGTYKWSGSYGYHVIIDHGERLTLYAHLSEFSVQPGERVQQGEEIGKIGSTGYSDGPHLHFGVIERSQQEECKWVNPWNLLPR